MNLARLLLESVGVAWLAVVAAQYGLKLLVPDAPDLSNAYLPLLASTLIAGIISYRWCRPGATPPPEEAGYPAGTAEESRESADGDDHTA